MRSICLVLLIFLSYQSPAQNCEAKTLYYENFDARDIPAIIGEMKTYLATNSTTPDCRRRINYLIGVMYEITGKIDSATIYFNGSKSEVKFCKSDTAFVETYLSYTNFLLRRNNLTEAKLLLDSCFNTLKKYVFGKATGNDNYIPIITNLDESIFTTNQNAAKLGNQYKPTQLYLLRQYYQAAGIYETRNNNPDEAKKNYILSYQYAKANPLDSTEGNILNNLGLTYSYEGFYLRAVEFLNESLLISEKQNDETSSINTLINLSFCFRKVKKYQDAETYASRALAIANKNGYSALFCRSSSFVARALALQNQVPKAEKIMKQSIDTAIALKLTDELAYNYRSLAQLMLENNYKTQEAGGYAQQARKLLLQINDSSYLNATDLTLGTYYLKISDLNNALYFAKSGLNFCYQFNDFSEIDGAYKLIADVYTQMKNYKMANIFLQKYETIKDSLTNREVQLTVLDMERKYNNQSKLLTIATLEKDKKENELILKQKENKIRLFVIISIATILALLSFFYFNRKLATQKKALQQSNVQLENLTGVQNRLFKIIGHDLKSMIIPFSRAGKILKNYIANQQIDNTITYANKLEENSTRLSSTVNNLLFWSVQQLDGYKIQKTNIPVSNTVTEVLQLFDELIELKNIVVINNLNIDEVLNVDKESFQIIVRNIFSNAIKFTSNASIFINSTLQKNVYTLSISDEGIGMNKEKIEALYHQPLQQTTAGTNDEKGSGIGFSIIKKMLLLNDGTLSIQSEEKKGTTISISFLQ
jgi:signal transduction histidine kinase/tetratricopeptide (TPR) repeat protein